MLQHEFVGRFEIILVDEIEIAVEFDGDMPPLRFWLNVIGCKLACFVFILIVVDFVVVHL